MTGLRFPAMEWKVPDNTKADWWAN